MEDDIATADHAWAHASREGGGNTCNAQITHARESALLSQKNLPSLLRDVPPVHCIKIMAFLVVPQVLPLLGLIFLNVQLPLLLNSRLISIGTDDNILAIGQL